MSPELRQDLIRLFEGEFLEGVVNEDTEQNIPGEIITFFGPQIVRVMAELYEDLQAASVEDLTPTGQNLVVAVYDVRSMEDLLGKVKEY